MSFNTKGKGIHPLVNHKFRGEPIRLCGYAKKIGMSSSFFNVLSQNKEKWAFFEMLAEDPAKAYFNYKKLCLELVNSLNEIGYEIEDLQEEGYIINIYMFGVYLQKKGVYGNKGTFSNLFMRIDQVQDRTMQLRGFNNLSKVVRLFPDFVQKVKDEA